MAKINFTAGSGKAAAGKAANHAADNAAHNEAASENTIHVMVFQNPEFGKVRILIDKNGDPLFCGKDVCEALGYKNTQDAICKHLDGPYVAKRDVWVETGKKADGTPAKRSTQMLFVTESGLYCLIFGSKLESAQRFKLWVTSVVLPQIRKTGGYIPLREDESEEDLRQRTEDILRKTLEEREQLIEQQKKLLHDFAVEMERKNKLIDELDMENGRLLPKAVYVDEVLNSVSCYTTTQIAKELGLTAQELNRQLCSLHVQYYQSGQYLLYADYAHRGFAKSRTHFETEHLTRTYLVWTERGREFIHRAVLR